MGTKQSEGFGRKLSAAACASALAVVGAYCAAVWSGESPAAIQPEQPEQIELVALRGADLEKAFWICDYTATVKGVNLAPVDLCSAVTQDLKNEKFGGDFDEMVKWWKENKPAEHQLLAAQGR